VLLFPEGVGRLAAGVAKVELQDWLSDVLVRAAEEIAPLEIARCIPSRKQIDRVPMAPVLLDETRVAQWPVNGGERARRVRSDDLQQHERAERSLDAVRIVGEQPRPLRHVALDDAHALVAEVVSLW